MANSTFTFALYIFSIALLFQFASGYDPILAFRCSKSQNYFARNSPYEKNLRKLLDELPGRASSTGFTYHHAKAGPYDKQGVSGLSQCLGNISSTDCVYCVTKASAEIQKLCPNNKEAILWYDGCLLKYSDTHFFGKIDNENVYSYWVVQNATDPITFDKKLKELLGQLIYEAPYKPKMFATGYKKVGECENVYSKVQCTNDLSTPDCKTCLFGLVHQMDKIGHLASSGAQIASGSCKIRYKNHTFVGF